MWPFEYLLLTKDCPPWNQLLLPFYLTSVAAAAAVIIACFFALPAGVLSSVLYLTDSRFQWPGGLRLGSAATHLLGLRVWNAPGTWVSVCCECCVLSARGLCDGLIALPEESYRLLCVWLWSWSLCFIYSWYITCLLLFALVHFAFLYTYI